MIPIYTRDLDPQTLQPIAYGKQKTILTLTHRTTTEPLWMEQINRSGRYGDYIVTFSIEERDGQKIAVESWLYKPEWSA